MADLVLGVAKSLVDGTLSRAQSALEEESRLRKSTRRDLVFITGEFQMMQSYLSTTSRDNVKNNVVSTWVTQLRDLTYDVEDGIEFVVHLDPKPDWWLRVIPTCIAPSRPLDEAVDVIEELKARVQDVRQRISHYNLISDSGPMPVVSKEKNQAAASHVRNEDIEALANMITKKTLDLQVISVWVPGGDLESALSTARMAYANSGSWRSFTCRAWVNLEGSVNTAGKSAKTDESSVKTGGNPVNNDGKSVKTDESSVKTGGNPVNTDEKYVKTDGESFETDEFVKTLLNQLESSNSVLKRQSMPAKKRKTPEAKTNALREVMEKFKCLVVLEGVSTLSKWYTILQYFPDNKTRNGTRIIVITKQFEVAISCTGRPYIYMSSHSGQISHFVSSPKRTALLDVSQK